MSKSKAGPPQQQERSVSLAFKEITEITPEILQRIGSPVELDLSNNNITDLSPLRGLTNLETLVLDNNQLTSHCKLPPLPRLHTLWVNKNKISNLTAFIERVEQQAPNLKFLSMLGNEACPNYFNSGTPKQYKDYRLYVISRLKKLEILDDTHVTDAERQLAAKIYGNLPKSKSSEEIQKQTYEERKKRREQRELERKARKEEMKRKAREERKRKRREEKKAQKKETMSMSNPVDNSEKVTTSETPHPQLSKLDLPTLEFLETPKIQKENDNKLVSKESNDQWIKDLALPELSVSSQSTNYTPSNQETKSSEHSTKPTKDVETPIVLPVVPLPLEERTFVSLFTKNSENENIWIDSDNDVDESDDWSQNDTKSNESSEWSDTDDEKK